MPDHVIRLRGGWDWDAGPTRRVSLPIDDWPTPNCLVRLVRRFQSPPIDPRDESLWLRLDAVPGLRSVHLNGGPLIDTANAGSAIETPLYDVLPAGNRLELLVETGEAVAGGSGGWGLVALIVRSGAREGRLAGGGSGL
jgi:hypothetical protein